jgi:hypothetical protein
MGGLRELLGTPREWALDLAVATGIGAFLGLIGPFGSFYGGPLETRLAYWIANLWIRLIILSLATRLSMRAARRIDLPVWFALPAAVGIGCLPLAWLVELYSMSFWPGAHGRMAPFLTLYGQTLAISEPCAFGYYFLLDRRGRRAALAPPAPARFLDRLSPRLGRNLLCLQMEDHYVRAHTDLGSELILTPLKAAVAELSGVEGAQVHRSWWVASSAVEAPVMDGRNHALRLKNGLQVPVSRASVAKVRAMGWIRAPNPSG